jgi:hypothetical protein
MKQYYLQKLRLTKVLLTLLVLGSLNAAMAQAPRFLIKGLPVMPVAIYYLIRVLVYDSVFVIGQRLGLLFTAKPILL